MIDIDRRPDDLVEWVESKHQREENDLKKRIA